LAACGVAVAGAAGARLGGVEATWLGALQLAPTVVLLVAFAAAVDIALSGFSPGANDNASGVAVAIALFEQLRRDGAPALLLVGAGHAVRRPRGDLELGPCGAGRPVARGRRISCVDDQGVTPRAHQADDTVVDDETMEAALSAAARAASRPA
jgi:hypothetical protein